LVDQQIFYGNAPKDLAQLKSGFKIEVLAENGSALSLRFLRDPRITYLERFLENGTIEGKTVVENETSFTLVVPFTGQVKFARLLDDRGREVANASLDEAIAFFTGISDDVCDPDFERDVDCQAAASAAPSAAASAATTTSIASVVPSPNASPSSTVVQQSATAQATQDFDFGSLLAFAFIVLLAALVVYGLFFSRRKKELEK
jgi:hypothetical protein